jgi:nucleoside-diphosphate-sugar epimerase
VIRWIKERLGTGPRNAIGDGPWLLLDARFLVDKAGNPTKPICDMIEQGANAYRQGQTVIVACDFGMSRSNAIAAGILSRIDAVPYDAAVREVMESTGEREIKLDLVETVRASLGESPQRTDRKTILITGATGFIGRNLVDRLQGTYKVLAPPRSVLDLDDGAAVFAAYCAREGVGQIVHLAYPRAYTNAAAAGSALTMLRVVLDTCRLLKIRLIFMSGWVMFSGYPASALIADETTPLRPKGVYGETKYLEELLVDLHYQRGDIDRTICRLAPVYGFGGERPRLIQTFHEAALNGEIIKTHKFRNGRPALDLLHISDAVEALTRVLDTTNSDIFHFGTGILQSTTDIASTIAQLVGKPMRHEEIIIDEYTSNVAFPAEKARSILNWHSKISVEQGLASMLSSGQESRA